jgi:hypothetical protein
MEIQWTLDAATCILWTLLPTQQEHVQVLLDGLVQQAPSDVWSPEGEAGRLHVAWTSRKQRHALRIRTASGECWHIFVYRSHSTVRWESPLISCQRAEGFFLRHRESDVSLSRHHPADTYNFVSICLRVAFSAPTTASPAILSWASQDFAAFSTSSSALFAQFQRVKCGGLPWTREEQTDKFKRLTTMASAIAERLRGSAIDTLELSEVEHSILQAYYDAQKALGEDRPGYRDDCIAASIVMDPAADASRETSPDEAEGVPFASALDALVRARQCCAHDCDVEHPADSAVE